MQNKMIGGVPGGQWIGGVPGGQQMEEVPEAEYVRVPSSMRTDGFQGSIVGRFSRTKMGRYSSRPIVWRDSGMPTSGT